MGYGFTFSIFSTTASCKAFTRMVWLKSQDMNMQDNKYHCCTGWPSVTKDAFQLTSATLRSPSKIGMHSSGLARTQKIVSTPHLWVGRGNSLLLKGSVIILLQLIWNCRASQIHYGWSFGHWHWSLSCASPHLIRYSGAQNFHLTRANYYNLLTRPQFVDY